MTQWKDIPGWEELYQVSTCGNFRKYTQEGFTRKKTTWNKQRKYLYISLQHQGYRKNCLAHRLVALAFIDNPENKPCINHKDFNRKNNKVSNLEWCTRQENTQHAKEANKCWSLKGEDAAQSRLTEKQVIEIHHTKRYTDVTNKELAEYFNVGESTITHILLGSRWNHIWQKVNQLEQN